MNQPERATVFVDVDGVVLVAGDPLSWPPETWRRKRVYLESLGVGLVVHWSTGVVDGLRDVAALPSVAMAWLTTWMEQAPEVVAPLIGIGSGWPVGDSGCVEASARQAAPGAEWWKAAVVRGTLALGGRVVWVDDEIAQWRYEVGTGGRRHELGWMDPTRLLAVSPSSGSGLESHHIDVIERFITTGERPQP